MALCITRGEPIAENKTTKISIIALKKSIGWTGVEFRWYPRKELAALTEEQKDELREFTNLAAGKKQKEANAWLKA